MSATKWWVTSGLAIALGLLLAAPGSTAGSSSVTTADPGDQAAESYNRGIEHRDKAWRLEKEAASAAAPDQRSKLENKARKEYEKAIRAFRSACEANPRMHQAFSSLGYALRKTGEYEESLQAYDKALELRPGYSEAIEYRAEAYLGLNRLEEAKQAYLELFRSDRERADELMVAMQRWLEARRANSGGLDAAVIEEFAAWVEERSEIAAQTASLSGGAARTW